MPEHLEQDATGGTTCRAVKDSVDEQLSAIDDLVRGLQDATIEYRHRPLDWGDVACLSQVREQIGGAVKGFSSAERAARLRRAARQVGTELRPFR